MCEWCVACAVFLYPSWGPLVLVAPLSLQSFLYRLPSLPLRMLSAAASDVPLCLYLFLGSLSLSLWCLLAVLPSSLDSFSRCLCPCPRFPKTLSATSCANTLCMQVAFIYSIQGITARACSMSSEELWSLGIGSKSPFFSYTSVSFLSCPFDSRVVLSFMFEITTSKAPLTVGARQPCLQCIEVSHFQ